MNKCLLSVTIIGWGYLTMEVTGFAYHLAGFRIHHPLRGDVLWIELVFLLAFVTGLYILRGRNWTRWLALAWMAFHVILTILHPLPQLAIHSLLLAVLVYFLFRPTTNRYFRIAGQ